MKLVMSSAAPASSVTESATCAPTRILRKRCCRTLPLAPTPAETNEQQIGDIAARDEQHETYRGEKSGETRAEIARHVLGQCPQRRREDAVDLVRILGPITLVE